MTHHSITPADQQALQRLIAVVPEWTAMETAAALTSCADNVLLHAGPAFNEAQEITAPILNSARVASVFQGLAKDFDDARQKIDGGEIVLQPAQDHGVVTPLASVVSMAMPLHVVSDSRHPDNRAFAPINGGGGPAMRLGLCSQAVLDHLRWINGEFADQLIPLLSDEINLLEIASRSLSSGDDCHGRTLEATKILADRLGPGLDPVARQFLKNGPSFFLNLWMAAVKCMMQAGDGVKGSSLITGAGANGRETGIKISGLKGRWFTAHAEPPHGSLVVDVAGSRKLGAIGDSAVVDGLGLGAMSMNLAPAQKAGLGAYMPSGGFNLPEKILSIVHPGFGDIGLRVGTLARIVCESGRLPVVSLGVLDNTGELGRLGGGIFIQPSALFEQAIAALDSATS